MDFLYINIKFMKTKKLKLFFLSLLNIGNKNYCTNYQVIINNSFLPSGVYNLIDILNVIDDMRYEEDKNQFLFKTIIQNFNEILTIMIKIAQLGFLEQKIIYLEKYQEVENKTTLSEKCLEIEEIQAKIDEIKLKYQIYFETQRLGITKYHLMKFFVVSEIKKNKLEFKQALKALPQTKIVEIKKALSELKENYKKHNNHFIIFYNYVNCCKKEQSDLLDTIKKEIITFQKENKILLAIQAENNKSAIESEGKKILNIEISYKKYELKTQYKENITFLEEIILLLQDIEFYKQIKEIYKNLLSIKILRPEEQNTLINIIETLKEKKEILDTNIKIKKECVQNLKYLIKLEGILSNNPELNNKSIKEIKEKKQNINDHIKSEMNQIIKENEKKYNIAYQEYSKVKTKIIKQQKIYQDEKNKNINNFSYLDF
jgi:hypothetical protein